MLLIRPKFEILKFDCDIEFIEKAARTCYKSEPKGDAAKFVKKICRNNHLSTIEHSLISVKITADRGFLGEITRHRLCSFSVESTRYVNYNKKGIIFIIPPWLDIKEGEYKVYNWYNSFDFEYNNNPIKVEYDSDLYYWLLNLDFSARTYDFLITKESNRWSPEQARSVLPLSLATEFVMSANAREWLTIFNLRCDNSAHPQMREIMIPLRYEFIKQCPVIFDDKE